MLDATPGAPRQRGFINGPNVFGVCAAVSVVVAVALAGWFLQNDAEQIDVGAGATITCAPQVVTYGSLVTCTSEATVGASVVWPDGHRGAEPHIINQVGATSVQLVTDSGITLATTEVLIEPDLAVTCEVDDWKNVYEFAATKTKEDGWDYVYRNPATGERVAPGHTQYPADPGLTDFELIVIDRVQETGRCTATSNAADVFDGEFTFTMGSKWEQHSVPYRALTPYSDHHWKGTQPGFIDISVVVNNATVSERRNIYFSGCT